MLTDWLLLTHPDGGSVYVQPQTIVAIKPHEKGAVVYLVGFADMGWIVTATPDEIMREVTNTRISRVLAGA